MSTGADALGPAPSTGQGGGVWAFLRRISWFLLNLYGVSVTVTGLGLLVLLTIYSPPHVDPLAFFALVALSAIVRLLGFPVGTVTNSLFGIVDLTTLLLYGPVVGGWQAALSVLLHTAVVMARRRTTTIWAAVKLPLFNAGLKALMALISGSVYLWLGGPLPPTSLDARLIIPGLALVLCWFDLDYAGWSLLELIAGGRTRFVQWTRYAVVSALLVELIPLPLAFLGASVAINLGRNGALLIAISLVLASLSVRLMAQARERLEARVSELTVLNRVSEEIIRASGSEQDICEIIYRSASQVVDTTYFLLGLLDGGGQTETLAVLVAEGERQEPRTLSVGGVVTWMQEHRRPLVVTDLHKQQLPFASRQVGKNAGLVRSALFVPMLAGQDLIGFISIQSQLPNAFTQDDTRILAAMANQAALAIANIRLQRQAETQARLERELRLASDIQRSLLPASCPVVPGFEIAAHWRSAREVSGDFYDFLSLSNGRLGIVIGDVSDKGVPAALFMALSRSLVRSGLLGASSPADGLRHANRWIMKDTASDMFLTLFYAVLDPANHTLTYVNAGHNPPLLLYSNEKRYQYLDRHGIALGVKEEAAYGEHTVRLGPGDVLVLYTDGVCEAMNADGALFGEDQVRLLATLHADQPPATIIARLNEAIAGFVGDEPASDDATLIVLRCV